MLKRMLKQTALNLMTSRFCLQTFQVAEHSAPPPKETDGVSFVCRTWVIFCGTWSPLPLIVQACQTIYFGINLVQFQASPLYIFSHTATVLFLLCLKKMWQFLYVVVLLFSKTKLNTTLHICLQSIFEEETLTHSYLTASSLTFASPYVCVVGCCTINDSTAHNGCVSRFPDYVHLHSRPPSERWKICNMFRCVSFCLEHTRSDSLWVFPRLEPGRYLIAHKVGEPFVTLLKEANGKVTRGAYDLQKVHSCAPTPPASGLVPWIPVDPAVVLPFHHKHGQIPCSFPIKPMLEVCQLAPGF